MAVRGEKSAVCEISRVLTQPMQTFLQLLWIQNLIGWSQYVCGIGVSGLIVLPIVGDPHVFGSPGSGSGSIIQRIQIRLRILPYPHKGVERT
jgi:hypothetical protein